MSVTTRTICLGLSALAASLPLAAQTASALSNAAEPAYQSAFEGYRPFEAGEVQDWRKSNDTAREVGGWRAYAREMRSGAVGPAAGASAPQSQTPQAQPKQPDPHAGHRQ
jgi:hypothetical protein